MGEFLADLHRDAPTPKWVCGGWAADELVTVYMTRRLSESFAKALGGGHSFSKNELVWLKAASRKALQLTLHECQSRRIFVHGGFTAANVSAREIEGTVELLGVFDFEDAHPGDIGEDFAYVGLYGLEEPRLRGLVEGYGLKSCHQPYSCATAHIRFWTIVNALGIIELGSRLGDVFFIELVFSAVSVDYVF
jgi:aminoglycoside phosphotransferase (APT) family kinase protein